MNPFAPGTTFGPYRLDHQLGKGGMGTVYRATDTKLNRAVAIKFVSTDLADASARRRFQREAHELALDRHFSPAPSSLRGGCGVL